MEDYPRTLEEFEGRFATEQACREYLMQLRWPQGFVCPRRGGRRARPSRRGLLRCGQCDYQASVTAGTIFQDTRLPLRTWFRTMWWVTSQKNGASALGLQSILGLGSYRTAWALLHKLRRAMVRPGRERLSGRVEVDETYVGGAEEGLRGRQTQKKALVAIAAEEDGAGIGRIRMKRIRGASKQQLHGFIQEAVEPDSTIHTDGWEGYVGLEALGYRHEYDFLAGSSQSASELLPHVHRVAALLKRWLIGTHQGAVSREHLDYYLDEYTFRFNRRRSRHRGKLFYRLVQQAATVGPTTYSEMVQHLRGRRTGQPQDVGWSGVKCIPRWGDYDQEALESANRINLGGAYFNLGVMYAEGQGVPRDYAEAVAWLRKAAEQGVAAAWNNLGVMYADGQSVPQDDAEAVAWYRKAAEQGDTRAQTSLGFMYDEGQGVPQDYTEALKWYRKAAEQGDAVAQTYLGFMYDKGRGVRQDYDEAVTWYRKAAEQGNASAWNNLGWLYATAKDPRFRDPAQAVECALKAVALTDEKDPGGLDTLAEAYFVSGEHGKAVETIRKAIALKPNDKYYQEQLDRFEQGG